MFREIHYKFGPSLPEDLRLLVQARFVDGRSHEWIMASLGLNQNRLRRRLEIAKRMLVFLSLREIGLTKLAAMIRPDECKRHIPDPEESDVPMAA